MKEAVRCYFSNVEILRQSYIQLRELNPSHGYLRYASFEEDGTVIVKDEFLRAFKPKNIPTNDVWYSIVMLQKTNEELGAVIKELNSLKTIESKVAA